MNRLFYVALLCGLVLSGRAGADESFVSIQVDAAELVDMTAATLTATCTITEIVASNTGKGIDKKLDKLKPWLGKAPFASWTTMSEVAEQTVTVEQNKPLQVKLSSGTLTLLLKSRLGPNRLQFDVDVDDKGGKRVMSTTTTIDSAPLMLGDVLKRPDGTYILALDCQ